MKKRTTAILAAGIVGALALTGCSPADDTPAGEGKELTLAVFNGWDEGVATSELWKAILEENGYTVNLEYADPAPVYLGLSEGDYDLTMDIWLPDTHATYMEKYGDKITDLGAWNTESKLTFAVNEDAPIDSIDELLENADLFGNRIVGIEPGAGLTEATEERVIPDYNLGSMQFITSSTTAMLSELTAATKSGENIVVTLWEPHWAYGAFPLKNLEDPKGSLGSTESIHAFGKKSFESDFPEVAKWINNFEMDLETLYSLEKVMFVDYDGKDYAPIVKKWMDDNRDYVDALTS